MSISECKNASHECPLCRGASSVRNEMRHWLSGLVWETCSSSAADEALVQEQKLRGWMIREAAQQHGGHSIQRRINAADFHISCSIKTHRSSFLPAGMQVQHDVVGKAKSICFTRPGHSIFSFNSHIYASSRGRQR